MALLYDRLQGYHEIDNDLLFKMHYNARISQAIEKATQEKNKEIQMLMLENQELAGEIEDLKMEIKILKEEYADLEENSIRTDCDYIPDCYEY